MFHHNARCLVSLLSVHAHNNKPDNFVGCNAKRYSADLQGGARYCLHMLGKVDYFGGGMP
jgi:hypothetical protein